MTGNKKIFEKNIEKLMKLTSTNDQPGKAFVDKLIDNAMDQLKTPQQNRKLNTRTNTMKLTFKRAAALAAAFIIVAGILSLLKTDLFDKTKEYAENADSARVEKPRSFKNDLVAIPLELPPAMFVGTPANLRISNLEKPRTHPRPPFLAPAGTVNIAAGKPVSSSDEFPVIGTLAHITDGDKAASDGSWVELGPFVQHVTIDLGARHNIYAIVFWHYHKQARVYYDIIVQVADDPDFITNVVTLFNNDTDNSIGLGVGKDMNYVESCEGKLIDARGVQARYVRMYSNGNTSNDMNHYIEIEVFGKPVDNKLSDGKISKEEKPQTTQEKLVSIPLELPKAMFIGTPQNFKFSAERQKRSFPMAHGGTIPPNDEAYDAMFFKNYGVNPFIDTEDDHLSTFAADVDTGSYTMARTYLQGGNLPPEESVRVEEFVNYFDYNYQAPQNETFAVFAEACPWQLSPKRKNTYMLRLGLKAMEISNENRKAANLTFVIDVSGSMGRDNRLGLVKKSLRILVDNLKENDTIGIAVYGSRGRKILEHTGADQSRKIISAIESLSTDGSTNAEEGIRIGYEMAEKVFEKSRINRVILCSDGVANVGRTGPESIFKEIKDKAEKGITLSALGFGMGNYNDVLMEQLGNKGNGHYSYIDSIRQAERLFGENLTGTLQVIARDVKLQVDFNPDVVRSYRLIGYENRDVADDKFRDDKQDGGEMGAGHSTTALYELKLWPGGKGAVATTYIRWKDPESMEVAEFNSIIKTSDIKESFEETSAEFALAAAVTEFAEILRKSHWAQDAKLEAALEKARQILPKFKDNTDVIELTDLIAKAVKFRSDQ